MINYFTDKSFLIPENRKRVFPLLFQIHYLKNENIVAFYQVQNSIETANLVIVPLDIIYFFNSKTQKWLYNFIDEALKKDKKVWVYTSDDLGITLNRPVYTFRFGGFESKMNDKTIVMPSFLEDPYIHVLNKKFEIIPKSLMPKIGFVGQANGGLITYFREFLIYLNYNFKILIKTHHSDYQPFYPIGFRRFSKLKKMENDTEIETDFIYRKKYRDGVKTSLQRQKSTVTFFENIFNNPYTFCMRGGGNFSVRFYEALIMGRIPVVLNTDIRLPFYKNMDWNIHCVLVSENNFLDEFKNFHKQCADLNFEKMQVENRNLGLKICNSESYFILIHHIFEDFNCNLNQFF